MADAAAAATYIMQAPSSIAKTPIASSVNLLPFLHPLVDKIWYKQQIDEWIMQWNGKTRDLRNSL